MKNQGEIEDHIKRAMADLNQAAIDEYVNGDSNKGTEYERMTWELVHVAKKHGLDVQR